VVHLVLARISFSGKDEKGNAVKVGNSSRCCKLYTMCWTNPLPLSRQNRSDGKAFRDRSKSEDLPIRVQYTFWCLSGKRTVQNKLELPKHTDIPQNGDAL